MHSDSQIYVWETQATVHASLAGQVICKEEGAPIRSPPIAAIPSLKLLVALPDARVDGVDCHLLSRPDRGLPAKSGKHSNSRMLHWLPLIYHLAKIPRGNLVCHNDEYKYRDTGNNS